MQKISAGIENLNLLLEGGIPIPSVIIIAGPEGIGKTTFIHQMIFENATPEKRAFYLNTSSKPTLEVIKAQRPFTFFDPKRIGYSLFYADVKTRKTEKENQAALSEKVDLALSIVPAYIVIDSFRDFRLTTTSNYKFWRFVRQMIKPLTELKSTVFLVGEWGWEEIEKERGLSLADGIFYLTQIGSKTRPKMGLHILKMKKTTFHDGWYPYNLNENGLSLSLAEMDEEEVAASIKPHKKVKRVSWWDKFLSK